MTLIIDGRRLIGAYHDGRAVAYAVTGGRVVWRRNLLANPGFETSDAWTLSSQTSRLQSNLTLRPHSGAWFINSTEVDTWAVWQRVRIPEAGTYELSAWFASGAIDRSHMLAVGTLDGRPLASQTWPQASAILTWEKRTLTVTIPTPMTVTVKLGGNWPRIDDASLTRGYDWT